MLEVFVVIRTGIYRHELMGVFDSLAKAKAAACDALIVEPDDHHTMQIVRCAPNQLLRLSFPDSWHEVVGSDDLVCTLVKAGSTRPRSGHKDGEIYELTGKEARDA